MPRSNKKKKHAIHPVVPVDDSSIVELLNKEKFLMIARAIVSVFHLGYGSYHGTIFFRQVLRDME